MPPTGTTDPRDTPAMRQHARFKARHPECLLLFRIGDFYEMFDDDAVKASRAIGLTLTQRTAGIPMAGVPYHQLENYLRKLMAAGFRVAVCEQTQDAAEAKGIVERAVTRVLTPGTLIDEPLLDAGRANHLAAVCFPPASSARESHRAGGNGTRPTSGAALPRVDLACLAFAELSTGSFTVLTCAPESLTDELARRQVSELVYPETADAKPPPRIAGVLAALPLHATPRPQWQFRPSEASTALREQFGVATLAGFGFEDDDPVLCAAGALVRYMRETQSPGEESAAGAGGGAAAPRRVLAHMRPPRRERLDAHLQLEASTLRALEVDQTIRAAPGASPVQATDGSLAGVFAAGAGKGSPRTPIGKRLLRDWLCRPAADGAEIESRHAGVECFVGDRRLAQEAGEALGGVQDVPRIAARIALGRATPRDLVALGSSLSRCADLDAALVSVGPLAPLRERFAAARAVIEPLARRLRESCVDDPPGHLREGGLIRGGIDAALDEARTLRTRAGEWCAEYQKRLIDAHSLPSLKVGYNKIFGYYIELPKAQSARAPDAFTRRQTLTSAERYITPELKEFEEKVTTATARAIQREQELFEALCAESLLVLDTLHDFAEAAARLDVILAFADKAAARRWVRPRMSPEPVLHIVQGRHPVLDERLGSNFVPNDVELGAAGATARDDAPSDSTPARGSSTQPASSATLALITGPNMAGKSTFIRQTALLTLLAHAGSFVPADEAVIGLTDRIFTRVGADDALHAGQSTFMVEMTETASILHHATPRSLVVLDEIGRGTSTLDGLSLAWAIAESLAADPSRAREPGPRTLFATHYHELTQLEESFPGRVRNLHVAVREWGDQIVFLHRILPGRTDRSYGVHVAKLAGIPARTIERAREILSSLSVEHEGIGSAARRASPARGSAGDQSQLGLFTEYLPHPAVGALREVKLEDLTPMQAFDQLRRLKDLAADEP
ncbi:MAG: DNA mismatch repair protein MutS [Phycisphaerales bacterium]